MYIKFQYFSLRTLSIQSPNFYSIISFFFKVDVGICFNMKSRAYSQMEIHKKYLIMFQNFDVKVVDRYF